MAKEEQSLLSLIPESLHPQLFIDVEEHLNKMREEAKKKDKPTPEEIKKIVSKIM